MTKINKYIIVTAMLVICNITNSKAQHGESDPAYFLAVGPNYMGSDNVGLHASYSYVGYWMLTGASISPAYYRSISSHSNIYALEYDLHAFFVVYGGSTFIKSNENQGIGFTQKLGIGTLFINTGIMYRWDPDKNSTLAYYIKIGIPILTN